MTTTGKLSYIEAKQWAQTQSPKINGCKEWRQRSKEKSLPENMPAWPQGYYKEEFESWGEFLGTGSVAATKRLFKTYNQAKHWAQQQTPKITSKTEWYNLSKSGGIPKNIPKDPRNHYGEDFKGWGDFLGTGLVANQCRKMLSYKDLKQWIQDQSPIIYSREEYLRRLKEEKRNDLPTNPPRTYKKQFEGWSKFLGVRQLSSSSMIERMLKQELATFLPVDKSSTTKLLGEDGRLVQVDIFIPSFNLIIEYDGKHFHQGKETEDEEKTINLCGAHPLLKVIRLREHPLGKLEANDLLIKPGTHPLVLTKQVLNHLLLLKLIPSELTDQAHLYLKRTQMASDTIVGVKWQSYEKARDWARAQNFTTVSQWKKKSKERGFLPQDIPANPKLVYGDLFLGWSDFLGVPIVAPQDRVFLSYKEARAWAKENNILTGTQWTQLSSQGQLPKNLPSNPNTTYKDQWNGWGAFLGTGKSTDTHWASIEDPNSDVLDRSLAFK